MDLGLILIYLMVLHLYEILTFRYKVYYIYRYFLVSYKIIIVG